MARFSALLALIATVSAIPSPLTPDPSGDHLVGNGQGEQFITGGCLSTADCSQAAVRSCCAFISGDSTTGICSGFDVANANGKAGCGFGDGGAAASSTVAVAAPAASAASSSSASSASAGTCTVNTALSGSANVGTGAGTQFITGQCFSAADCASACCVAQADGTNLCKATLVTTEASLSCDATCDNAASTNTTETPAATAATTSAAAAPASTSAAAVAGAAGSAQCTVDTPLAGSESVGTGAGTQFITGQCLSKADCASGCCVAQTGGAALCKAELVTTEAGLSCDFSCAA